MDYVCLECGTEFTSESDYPACPVCGSKNTYRLLPCRTENIPIYSGPGDCQCGDPRWEENQREQNELLA